MTQAKHFYEFGSFRLDATQRLLLREGAVVPLTLKAFDLLLTLVKSNGQVLTKDELMRSVWPDSFVEEANLSHHIHKLREALGEREQGDKYIETLARRGYRFVAKVNEVQDEGGELVLQEHLLARVVVEESSDHRLEPEPFVDPQGRSAIANSIKRKKQLSPLVWTSAAVGLAVLMTAAYFLWIRHATPTIASTSQIRSLAVLPFKPLSAESHDESLELGMADALITKLSNLKQVVVRPTSSVLKYGAAGQDLLAAGREQGVDAIIEGQMQKAGDRIRFTVHLIRVSDGAQMWAGTFDDRLTNVFAVQDEISQEVAQALVSKLTGIEQQQIAKHYTDNIEAYQFYSKGRVEWYKFSPEGAEKSISYYNQAIALDPNYALAYAGLSFSYSVQGAIGSVRPVEAYVKSKAAAETAVRLDDSLAEGHVAMGGKSLFFERDWSNAKKEFERGIELNPNQPDAHQLLGYYWEVVQQYDKAAAEQKNAQRVAPLMGLVNMDVAALAYYQHHYDEAIDLYGKAHNLDPNFVPVPFVIGQIYERKGAYDRAIDECRKALSDSPDDPAILSTLGYAYARAGRKDDAQTILNKFLETRKQHYFPPFMIALLYTALDKKDEAFDWLNKAYDERDPQLIWVHLDPQLDSLHSDPRFNVLLQRMGIPQ
jgi:DNA-binding winged helix-turn-helix (wHTH) protein/TolB-like protein/tetratricopeptide (TPR) repeat protein